MVFVPRTQFPNYRQVLSYFQGHHNKALTKLRHLSPQIDLVLEVRDCRAPISTTNLLFDKALPLKEKIVLYSKKDLSVLKPRLLNSWHGDQIYRFIDCRSRADARMVIDLVKEKYQEMSPKPPLGLRLIVVGMPNVGKSTLVNTLRETGFKTSGITTKRRKVAQTGAQPGVTRNTSEIIRISQDPDIYLHDTPGVFLPTVRDAETMLSLSLVGCVPPKHVDPVIKADYLLYLLNLQDPSGRKYREYLNHPTNNIEELFTAIAKKKGTLRPDGTYDELGIAEHWTSMWSNAKSNRFKGCFDVGVILETEDSEIKGLLKDEQARINDMPLTQRYEARMGDGTNKYEQRERTAKDRQFDLRNRLFKVKR